MSCQHSKFTDVSAENLSRLARFIASPLNSGSAEMWYAEGALRMSTGGEREYQHVAILEVKPGSSPQHFTVVLQIKHYFEPTDDTQTGGDRRRSWHMSLTGKPMPVPREVIDALHDALGLFPDPHYNLVSADPCAGKPHVSGVEEG